MSTWLQLGFTKTKVAGHTSEYFFLIRLFDLGRIILNMAHLQSKEPLKPSSQLLMGVYIKGLGGRKLCF